MQCFALFSLTSYGSPQVVAVFSVANLGTRPVLVEDMKLIAWDSPDLHGRCQGKWNFIDGKPQQVIKAGDLISISVEAHWDEEFVRHVWRVAEKRGIEHRALRFTIEPVLRNPKGVLLTEKKLVLTLNINRETEITAVSGSPGEAFRLLKGPLWKRQKKRRPLKERSRKS
jgi:hypothetical protein